MKKKILVVDDADDMRLLLQEILKKEYDVITQPDGAEGIKWLQSGNHPDLILSDIIMPNKNGYDFIKELRNNNQYKDIPVIMLSGLNTSVDKIESYKNGASDFITKPFNPQELGYKIKSHMKYLQN